MTLLRRFLHDRVGVAAVEFALLLPLLLLFYTVLFETGRGWLAKRKFNVAIESAARYAVRYPQFDSTVRQGLPLVVGRTLAPLGTNGLNLSLVSARMDRGEARVVFTHAFFGNAVDIPWRHLVNPALFAQTEPVVIVVGRYSYDPILFGNVTGPIVFETAIAVNPFFSRSYEYESGVTDFDFFNVR